MSETFEITNLEMKMGMTLKIKAKIVQGVDRFHINLGQGKDVLNLHFNPRFNQSTIVCNSKNGSNWGQEHRDNHISFSPGSDIKFTVAFQNNEFKVTLPDGHKISFPNRLGHQHLKYFSTDGLCISSFKLD